jgi:hypothetical protein
MPDLTWYVFLRISSDAATPNIERYSQLSIAFDEEQLS